jgi:hypothetical protein
MIIEQKIRDHRLVKGAGHSRNGKKCGQHGAEEKQPIGVVEVEGPQTASIGAENCTAASAVPGCDNEISHEPGRGLFVPFFEGARYQFAVGQGWTGSDAQEAAKARPVVKPAVEENGAQPSPCRSWLNFKPVFGCIDTLAMDQQCSRASPKTRNSEARLVRQTGRIDFNFPPPELYCTEKCAQVFASESEVG